MRMRTALPGRKTRLGLTCAAMVCLLGGTAGRASAADYRALPVVKPVMSCDRLGQVHLDSVDGSAVTIGSAVVLRTPKGSYCKVTGTIAPGATFEVDLPLEHWTQRLYQSASTGGTIAVRSAAAPAANGELAVAINDRGGRAGRGGWTLDPARRISWAYEANHQTSVVAKALIKALYGKGPRFSYFMGCSGGGRESMIEAQRYGSDFDGVAAGAAAMILNISNGGFFHSWEAHANRRADGSPILAQDRLGILHDAVLANCAGSAGLLDGVLQVPAACRFRPS